MTGIAPTPPYVLQAQFRLTQDDTTAILGPPAGVRPRWFTREPPPGDPDSMIPPAVYLVVGFGTIFVMSVVLHEIGHGLVAYLCGDPTAKLAGRLSLNPIRHVDPVFTLLMPALFIWLKLPVLGGAKPVPVNPYHFRHPVRDDRLVSAAGLVVNIVIASVLAMLLHLLLWLGVVTWESPHAIVLGMGIISNLVLFSFNLMPIPPLDGSRLLRSILPWSARNVFDRMDRFGLMLVYGALFVTGFGRLIFVVVEFFWQRVFIFRVGEFWHVLLTFNGALHGG